MIDIILIISDLIYIVGITRLGNFHSSSLLFPEVKQIFTLIPSKTLNERNDDCDQDQLCSLFNLPAIFG